jgi:predicted ribosome quality control (RQC) complex YloA/Tae2 family protein
MDDTSIQEVAAEVQPLLAGRSPGRIFQLDSQTVAIDFRLRDHRLLLISVNPSRPRIHLINRSFRELEKQSIPLGQFALTLRKRLSNSRLVSIIKDPTDRIIRFEFTGEADVNDTTHATLIAQLTGRSANLFLLTENDVIAQRLRATDVAGQQVGQIYRSPGGHEPKEIKQSTELLKLIKSRRFTSPSAAADSYYQSIDRERSFQKKIAATEARLKSELARKTKLRQKLQADLASHADAEQCKRTGDLLLANASTARRSGNRVTLIDYFESNAPTIEVEIDASVSLPEEASRLFALYSRARRAVGQIRSRIEKVNAEIGSLTSKQQELDRIMAARDESALNLWSASPDVAGGRAHPADKSVPPGSAGRFKRVPGTRRHISSDGFEILIGRAAKDNDHLTFKVAKPNDLWLHSADYPGSHVVVRNPTRKDIPHRTIIEAAELAAYFSQANKNPKVDVHYTQRKFLSKPKRAAPGLVRMSRFKTMTVSPKLSPSQS